MRTAICLILMAAGVAGAQEPIPISNMTFRFSVTNFCVYTPPHYSCEGDNALTTRTETNTTTESDESGCKTCSDNPGTTPLVFHYGNSLQGCKPYRAPTWRTETTVVTEVKTLRFTWEGQEHTVEHRKELSRTVKKWVKKEQWEEEKR